MSDPTMTSRFAFSVAHHTIAGAALYAWRALGIEPAGNIFVFWMWFAAIAIFVSGLLVFSPPEKSRPKNRVLACLNLSAWLFFAGALVWLGYVFLPAMLVVGLVLMHALQSEYDADGNLKAKEPLNV